MANQGDQPAKQQQQSLEGQTMQTVKKWAVGSNSRAQSVFEAVANVGEWFDKTTAKRNAAAMISADMCQTEQSHCNGHAVISFHAACRLQLLVNLCKAMRTQSA